MLKVRVEAEAAILMNGKTGAILYGKNPHQMKYPASITKLATLLYALKQNPSDGEESVTCPGHCLKRIRFDLKKAHHFRDPAYWLEPDGSHYWIKSGEKLVFKELFYGMILLSGNDAANLIAHHVGGTIPQFLQGMNAYLEHIGCKETLLLNPHGLHHPDHVTSVYDMALVVQELISDKRACDIALAREYKRSKTNLQSARFFQNRSQLLREGKFFYPKILLAKSGYHKNARYTFAGAAEQEGRVLIAVLMGCESSDRRYRDAIRLFETAFAEEERVRPLFTREDSVFETKIEGGKRVLSASLEGDLSICYYPSEEPEIQVELEWKKKRLPIQKGEAVGEIKVFNENRVLLERAPLYALQEMRKRKGGTFLGKEKGITLGLSVALALSFLYWFLKKASRKKGGLK